MNVKIEPGQPLESAEERSMSQQPPRQSELTTLIERFTGADGVFTTPIVALSLFRFSRSFEPPLEQGANEPVLCLVAQGSKQIVVGSHVYRYDPSRYLLASVELPVVGAMVHANPELPYLGLRLTLEPGLIASLLLESRIVETEKQLPVRGISVSETDTPLLDAFVRLLRLLEKPHDIPVLAPLTLREIVYRLLSGERRAQLEQISAASGRTQRVARAIDYLKRHYTRPLLVEDIARELHMSPSSLHHHFKAVTTLSPLQFQKRLRLNEARRLLIAEALDVASAGFRVGYESATQFSREYSRLFGEPPGRDMARLRASYA